MQFLAPLFFVGLAAVAVPVLVHLIQRERKEVIHFPSLMFVRRIPYQSVQRRRIHNWLLLALRMAAMALLVAAFSRPFFKVDPLKAAEALNGARDVVILFDVSASMGYGDHFQQAQDAARKIVNELRSQDQGTLILFARNIEERVRATSDKTRLNAAIAELKPGSDSTRYGPALRIAQTTLSQAKLPRKEAYLISDFQKSGWAVREEIHLPEGATLTPISVASPDTSDVSVSSVNFERKSFSGEERVAVTAGLTNRGQTPVSALPVKLEIDGRLIDTRPISMGPNSSASVTFPPVTVADSNMRGVVHAGASDQLPKDNDFYFVLSPSRPVSVLIVQAEGTPISGPDSPGYYASTALGLSRSPLFKVDTVNVSRVNPTALEHRAVVILNDATSIPAPTDDLLKRYVEQGGGLLIAVGEHFPWGSTGSPLLPGKIGLPVDRRIGIGGTLGYLDYSHPIFELFKQPRQGDFTQDHFLRYRAIQPEPTDKVLARFDDGMAAMVERRMASGRIIFWPSTLDRDWTDFPQQIMFLPLLNQTIRYLSHFDQPNSFYTVGRMLDVSVPLEDVVREGSTADVKGPQRKASGVAESPSGKQATLGEGGVQSIELSEQGFYSVRMQGTGSRRPFSAAVNLDAVESDLTPLESHEFVRSATGRAAVTAGGQSLEHPDLTPEDIEKKQTVWWFLLLGAALALLAEAVLSNRLSKRFGTGLLQMRRPAKA